MINWTIHSSLRQTLLSSLTHGAYLWQFGQLLAAFSDKQLLFEAKEGKIKAFILAEEHSLEQCMEQTAGLF